tara:strand:- start:44 stop:358 length:315 start_codon:yes stop_codon:yes gene_type:complete
MANYLKVVNGIVTESIVADAEFMKTFTDTSPGEWIEDTDSIKGNGGIGQQYDPQLNAWYQPQPFPSWTLNTTTLDWEPPIDFPNDTGDKFFQWDEDTKSWKEIT